MDARIEFVPGRRSTRWTDAIRRAWEWIRTRRKSRRGKPWKIVIHHFREVDAALGRDVMREFCRCFVHADRLTSTISAMYASQEHHGRDSVAFTRDLQSMVWFTIGTLRELARAIRSLRSVLKKRGILDPNSEPWVKLRDLEERWEGDPFFRRMRNQIAYHVDAEVIDAGLNELVREPEVELCRGEGPAAGRCSLTLGFGTLNSSLGPDLTEFGTFLEKVSDDHGIGSAIQGAFASATLSVGIPGFHDDDVSADH